MRHTELNVLSWAEGSDIDNPPGEDISDSEEIAFDIDQSKTNDDDKTKDLTEQLEEKLLSSLSNVFSKNYV